MKAKSAKAKGAKLEKEVVRLLKAVGLQARKQPGSGVYADFPHDVELTIGGQRYIVECKSRASGFQTLDRWRGVADLLVVKVDRGTPMAYLPLATLAEMIES